MKKRKFININGLKISYLDYEGSGKPMIFLHGHFGCGNIFTKFAREFINDYRVICMDQRGHGWSDKADDYTREAYINDIYCLVKELNLSDVILIGHSLGGVNVYQFAARHPELVKAIVVEDIGNVVNDDPTHLLSWPKTFDTIREMKEFLKTRNIDDPTFFLESMIETEDGWRHRCNYDEMIISQNYLNNDHTDDWKKATCPALLMHGGKSWVMNLEMAKNMEKMRDGVKLVYFPECGHSIHDEDPDGYMRELKEFIKSVDRK
jgi:esterase